MKEMSNLWVMFFVLVVLLAAFQLPADVLAQGGTGRITGTVSDPTGAVIPGSSVTITNQETGRRLELVTNEQGRYASVPLPPARYRIEASLPGFKTAVQTIRLEVDETAVVNIALEVGEITEQVEVIGSPPLLNTANSAQGEVIDERRIQDLPLNGRDYIQLALLSEGAIQPIGGRAGGFSTGGIRTTQNNYMLDGVDNNSVELANANRQAEMVKPSVDAIKEFKVQTNAYSAEYGRAAGGVVNLVTKSGTNEFHGSLFEFHRNDVLDARNFFNKEPALQAPFIRNQFGGTIGGPIVKDRAFFFFAYDDLRRRESQTFVSTIPTLKMRQGDFSEIRGTIFDPATFDPGTRTRQAFPGNKIPQERFDPIAAKLAQLFPDPQNDQLASNFTLSASDAEDVKLHNTRIDINVSQSDTFFYRMSRQKQDSPALFRLPPRLRGGGGVFDLEIRAWNIGFGWDHIFSPTFLTSVRGGWNRARFARVNPKEVGEENLSKTFGIKGVDQTLPGGFAQFDLSGFRSIGGSAFNGVDRDSQNRQISSDTTWINGDHTLKFGVNLLSMQNNVFNVQRTNGVFQFNGRFTNNPATGGGGNAFADFLLGIPNRFDISDILDTNLRGWYIGPYVQNDWKVTSRFTLNLGLRYELILPWQDLRNRWALFDIDSNPANPALVLAKEGRGGRITESLIATDTNNFAPRIGFAWEIVPNVVLRGGYGIFYTVNEMSGDAQTALTGNPPFFATSFITTDGIHPQITLAEGAPPDLLAPENLRNVRLISTEKHPSRGYAQHWNLNIQYNFARDWLWQVGYFATKGSHIFRRFDGNPAPLGPGNINAKRRFKSVEVPGTGVVISPLTEVVRNEWTGNSNFHSLQTKLQRRFSAGVTLLSSYIFSKTIDDVCGFAGAGNAPGCGFQDPTNLRLERGLSNQHTKHRFVTSFIYQLPFGRGRHWGTDWPTGLHGVLGGWNLAGIVTLRSGQPFSVTTRGDPANTGTTNRPNQVGDPRAIEPTVEEFFNTAAFQRNAPFTFGNVGRNTLTGPSLKNLDVSLMKNWSAGETVDIQFRLEAFNAFNRPQFNQPAAQLGASNFGRITSTTAPNRKLQAAIKIFF